MQSEVSAVFLLLFTMQGQYQVNFTLHSRNQHIRLHLSAGNSLFGFGEGASWVESTGGGAGELTSSVIT